MKNTILFLPLYFKRSKLRLPFHTILALLLLSACTGITTKKEDHKITSGTVVNITEGGAKDAVFHLDNNDTLFYINRGLEKQFTVRELTKQVANRKVSIYYVPASSASQHIFRMDVDGKSFYSEF